MSRSGYSYDLDNWQIIKWRGQVASAIRGKRGQKLMRDIVTALDLMPVKELITEDLIDDSPQRQVCTLGAVMLFRGLEEEEVETIDPEDPEQVAKVLDIAHQLAQEVVYMNDEWVSERPSERWRRMRKWAEGNIKDDSQGTAKTEQAAS